MDPKDLEQAAGEEETTPVEATAKNPREEEIKEQEDAKDDQVRTVEAEVDHEEAKEQKLPIPDFESLNLEQCLAVIKEHIGKYPLKELRELLRVDALVCCVSSMQSKPR